MAAKNILSVDLGTSSIKSALFDQAGGLVAVSSQEYALLTPSPLAVEVAVETYWRAFKKTVIDVLRKSKIAPASIAAIGFSAQGETLISADVDGNPLRDAIVWMDSRPEDEAQELSDHFADADVYGITGQVSIVPTWPASKILWIRKNEPEIFDRTAKFLLIEDYFIHRLTGRYVAEGSLLCSTTYWDINRKCYWPEMLERLSISESQLPEIRESGEQVGPLLKAVADELGLSTDTIVCTGILDQAAGGIGVGNITPGVFSECTGSALAIIATVDHSFKDPGGQMPCHYHGLPDTYMAHTFTTGGMAVKWFRDTFYQRETEAGAVGGPNAYEVMDEDARPVFPGSDGLVMLPHLQGAMAPENNPKARGVFFGATLAHGKGHFVRSILESIAYIVRRNIDVLAGMGIEVAEIRSLGGGAKSRLWSQIKADVTGRPVIVLENEEAACLGAAIVAGVAVGVFDSLESAVEKMVRVKKRYTPNPKAVGIYHKSYQKYMDLYEALVGVF